MIANFSCLKISKEGTDNLDVFICPELGTLILNAFPNRFAFQRVLAFQGKFPFGGCGGPEKDLKLFVCC